jgi:predicted nucleic acid-binding protein
MSTIPAVSEWKRIFIDTSFIIDSVRNLDNIIETDSKYEYVKRTHALIDYFNLPSQSDSSPIWITSSIVLSELSKFENSDAVSELQTIFNTPNIEIINFTKKEASFIVNDMVNYVEQKHISQYINQLRKDLAEMNIFNPKNYISNDALIIACAKTKRCDVVLTSDENSFMHIAKQVNLPVLLTKDLPIDTFQQIDYLSPITTK